MKRTSVIPLSLLAFLARAAPAVPQPGCGGCYAGGTISDLAATPPASCLALTAGAIDPCGGDYGITIANSCSDDLTLGAVRVAAGATTTIDGDGLCGDTTCSLAGSLGATPTTIRWTIVSDE